MRGIYPAAYGHYWKDDCSWYLNAQYGAENLRRELNEPDSVYYFVRYTPATGQPVYDPAVGILRLRTHCSYTPIPDKKAFKVHRLYLDASVQGTGIGSTLMDYATTTARQSGHDLIWLDAMETHQQAQGFYKSLGYERTQSQVLPFPLLHDEHRPMWFMHKML
jgi:ribosomal protein S18 acetylase RimI-like enzyme